MPARTERSTMLSWLPALGRADAILYALTFLLAVGLKLAWRDCPPTEPRVFLSPLVSSLKMLLGAPFARQAGGYWNEAGGVLITKDCGGMNYFLILHCLLVVSHIRSCRGRIKITAYAAFFAGAYLLTLIANLSRVLSTLMLGCEGLMPGVMTGQSHLALGAFVYFFFLVAGNSLAGWVLRRAGQRMEGL